MVQPQTLHKVIHRLNCWLCRRKVPYRFGIHHCQDEQETEAVYQNLTLPSNCHSVKLDDCALTYVYLKHVNTQTIATYIAFALYRSPVPYVDLVWGCTDRHHRRKGLSTLVRMVPIILALRLKLNLVVSDANQCSGPLLRNQFGFVWNDNEEYVEHIGNLLQWKSSPTAYLDLRNASVQKQTLQALKRIVQTYAKK